MTTIVRLYPQSGRALRWTRVAEIAAEWAQRHAVSLRDAVVLLPFAQLLPPARRAWGATGRWMPRIETTQTLARAIAPPVRALPGQLSFDAALDRLTARRLLKSHAWGLAWWHRDPRDFDAIVAAFVQTAHAVARAAAAVVPAQREDYFANARTALVAGGGPGATERLLARVALEWASDLPEPATDTLFTLQPSGWIVLEAGGGDPLSRAIADATRAPCLQLQADVEFDDVVAAVALREDIALERCEDFEDEAQRTAARIIDELNHARCPVALIAQDRHLVRRVRALLARQDIPLHDETGWKLSTTRAGAVIVSMLNATKRDASTDDWLDWLKNVAHGWPLLEQGTVALQMLEAWLRRTGTADAALVDPAALPPRAAALWQLAADVTAVWRNARVQPLNGWLALLRASLDACGAWSSLQTDEAGRQAAAALYLAERSSDATAATGDALTFDDFIAWVDDVLESSTYRPTRKDDAAVIVTPLERAMLRPFEAVVMPGGDEKRLSLNDAPPTLLDDATAAQLNLPTRAERRERVTIAFAHLLQLPNLSLLMRRDDDGEALAASSLISRLELARLRTSRTLFGSRVDARTFKQIHPAPVPRPLPVAPDLVPECLSASACEALRACPYRFYARHMLGLRETDELDRSIEKRDYGNWLHEVLRLFHAHRPLPRSDVEDLRHLRSAARELQRSLQLDDPSFLPFAASFERFAPRYLAWLGQRDLQGAQWLDGEREMQASPSAWQGIAMVGKLDRVDSVRRDGTTATQLIDYKTGGVDDLKRAVAVPQEDTQLAFYAALIAQQPAAEGPIEAMYLALDSGDRIAEVPHTGVQATAAMLVDGLGRDLARLRTGAALPALGEPPTCDFCDARGLCRRDHWADGPLQS